jgi:5-(carboxyamino)imidazole ribonucleotide mutase
MLQVPIVLGSESDFPVFDESKATEILDQCEVPWVLSVISADRNPGKLADYCNQLKKQEVEVIIAGAGMAARLPGTIAAHMKYHIPVIGVALPSLEFPNALDSLLSIIRTPAGCPVLFAGIGKAGFRNAAIAAVQILAIGEGEARKKIKNQLINYLFRAEKEPQIEFRKNQRTEK